MSSSLATRIRHLSCACLLFSFLHLPTIIHGTTRVLIYTYDARSPEEAPFLSGFRAVNDLYASRHGYTFKVFSHTKYELFAPPTWIKVLLGWDLLNEHFPPPESLGAGGTTGTATADRPTASPDDADDFILVWIDSDAVWHAHGVPLESLFPPHLSPLSEKGGIVLGGCDHNGLSGLLPHSSIWAVGGKKGRQLLGDWRAMYEDVRHMWQSQFVYGRTELVWECRDFLLPTISRSEERAAAAKGKAGGGDFDVVAAVGAAFQEEAEKQKKTNGVVRTEAEIVNASSSTVLGEGETPPLVRPEIDSARQEELRAGEKGASAGVLVENGRDEDFSDDQTAPLCAYPYYGYDTMSLLTLVAESARWEPERQKVVFDGFEFLPWSRMNSPFPFSLGVRELHRRDEGARKRRERNYVLAAEFDDQDLIAAQNDDAGRYFTEVVRRENYFYVSAAPGGLSSSEQAAGDTDFLRSIGEDNGTLRGIFRPLPTPAIRQRSISGLMTTGQHYLIAPSLGYDGEQPLRHEPLLFVKRITFWLCKTNHIAT